MVAYRALWHITPAYNVDSILIYGIEPSRSNGSHKRIWLVQWKGIVNALAHVSARHSVPVDKLVCIQVFVKPKEITHFRLSMWTSYITQKRVSRIIDGAHAIQSWDAQRKYKHRAASLF